MDGWSTLRLLRADDATDDLPVAMFSVKSEVRDKVAGLKDGAIDYITKPFGVDELASRVSRILAASGGAPAVPSASPR
jgi:DNA-binding response OmpR family regulator